MKTQQAIKEELSRLYAHRLQQRIDRKTKQTCRNCKHHIEKEFDLGDFGKVTRYICKDGDAPLECSKYDPLYDSAKIEEEFLNDISDPAICGAKEPKIAALLWVLHDNNEPGFFGRVKESVKNFLGGNK